jgi:hypothetical protein
MDSTEKYKVAPTFLHKKGETARLFRTQEGVDAAWADGWYGPPWLVTDKPLISDDDFTTTYGTKARLIDAVAADPRYGGLKLRHKKTVPELYDDLAGFEEDAGLTEDEE